MTWPSVTPARTGSGLMTLFTGEACYIHTLQFTVYSLLRDKFTASFAINSASGRSTLTTLSSQNTQHKKAAFFWVKLDSTEFEVSIEN